MIDMYDSISLIDGVFFLKLKNQKRKKKKKIDRHFHLI